MQGLLAAFSASLLHLHQVFEFRLMLLRKLASASIGPGTLPALEESGLPHVGCRTLNHVELEVQVLRGSGIVAACPDVRMDSVVVKKAMKEFPLGF